MATSLAEKINFWGPRFARSVWFHVKYRLNKWVNIEGVKFPVYPAYGYNVLRFISNGRYESGEIAIIKKTLHKEDRVLELGTGLGFISTYCSKLIGSDNVYTFEANPHLEKNIRELYQRNDVSPHLQFAVLGKEEGKLTFYRNKKSLLASSPVREGSGPDNEAIEVPQRKLNAAIAEIKPSYLIMDIEGGEYGIFMEIDFQSIRKVQFELHPWILDEKQVAQIFRKLEDNGFVRDASFKDENNYFFSRRA